MNVFIAHINPYTKHRAELEVLHISEGGSTTRRNVIVPTLFAKPEVKARQVADKLIAKWQRKLKVENPLITYLIEQ